MLQPLPAAEHGASAEPRHRPGVLPPSCGGADLLQASVTVAPVQADVGCFSCRPDVAAAETCADRQVGKQLTDGSSQTHETHVLKEESETLFGRYDCFRWRATSGPTAEQQLLPSVREGQVPDGCEAASHGPAQVTRVAERPHRQAVQVKRLHQVRQEGPLETHRTPPVDQQANSMRPYRRYSQYTCCQHDTGGKSFLKYKLILFQLTCQNLTLPSCQCRTW